MLATPIPTLSHLRADATALTQTATQALRNRSASALAAMLLAAIVAALVVAADTLIDTYADGHLLMAWTALWAVGFAAMALFADTARSGAQRLVRLVADWQTRRAQRHADRTLMALALRDPRIMLELQSAIDYAAEERRQVQLAHGRAWVANQPVGTLHAAYTGPRLLFTTSPLTGLPLHLQYVPR